MDEEELPSAQLVDDASRIIYTKLREIHSVLQEYWEIVAIDPGTKNCGVAMFNTNGNMAVTIRHWNPVILHNELREKAMLSQPRRFMPKITKRRTSTRKYTEDEMSHMAHSLISTIFNPYNKRDCPHDLVRRRLVLIEQQPPRFSEHRNFAAYIRVAAIAHGAEVQMPSVTMYKKHGLSLPVTSDRLFNKRVSLRVMTGLLRQCDEETLSNQFPDILTDVSKQNLFLSHDCCDAFLLLLSHLVKRFEKVFKTHKLSPELDDLCILSNSNSSNIPRNPTKDKLILLIMVLTAMCPSSQEDILCKPDRMGSIHKELLEDITLLVGPTIPTDPKIPR